MNDIRKHLQVQQIITEAKLQAGTERLVSSIINMIEKEKPTRSSVRKYIKNIEKTDKSWIQAMKSRMEEIGGDGGRAFFFSSLRRRAVNHFTKKR